jgi:hypothetical protein
MAFDKWDANTARVEANGERSYLTGPAADAACGPIPR